MSQSNSYQINELSEKLSKKMSINKSSDSEKSISVPLTKRASLTINGNTNESCNLNNESNGKTKSKKYFI